MRRHAWLLSSSAALLVVVCASRAVRADERCEGVRLDVADDLSPAWRQAGAELRSELVASDAPCVTVNLTLEPANGTNARLSATTRDGRHTDRLVARPALLVPTALGLVASLPPDPAAASPEAKAPQTNDGDATSAMTTSPRDVHNQPRELDDLSPHSVPSSATQVWLGANAGARIAEPTFLGMVDVEARFSLELDRWLVIGSLRYGSSVGESLVSTDDSYDEIAASIGIGRRFPIGASAIDIAIMPGLVAANLDDDDETGTTSAPKTELRIGASVQWWTSLEDGWRLTVTADTDVAPRGLIDPVRSDPEEPPLPAWTAGLRLGASGRLL